MSLLDDLEKKARDLQSTEASNQEKRSQQEAYYQAEVVPKLREVYDYLDKVVKNLSYLKPEKKLVFEIPLIGQLSFRPQFDYEMKVDHQRWSTQITMTSTCLLNQADSEPVEVEGEKNIKKTAKKLQEYMLASQNATKKDEHGNLISATFQVHGRVRQQVVISGSVDSERIEVSIKNYEGFTQSRRVMIPNTIDEEVMDQFARYLALEPSSFLREELPEDVRAKIRAKIAQEERQRTQEVKVSVALKSQQEELDKKSGIGSKLGPITKRFKLSELWSGKKSDS